MSLCKPSTVTELERARSGWTCSLCFWARTHNPESLPSAHSHTFFSPFPVSPWAEIHVSPTDQAGKALNDSSPISSLTYSTISFLPVRSGHLFLSSLFKLFSSFCLISFHLDVCLPTLTLICCFSLSLSLNFSPISSKTETQWVETVGVSFSLFIFTLHLVLWLHFSLPVSSLFTSFFPSCSHRKLTNNMYRIITMPLHRCDDEASEWKHKGGMQEVSL